MVTLNNVAYIVGGSYTTGIDQMVWVDRDTMAQKCIVLPSDSKVVIK
jgi:hypothetical protein